MLCHGYRDLGLAGNLLDRVKSPGGLVVMTACVYCDSAGGNVVWAEERWRILRIEDTDFPLFYRVVPDAHVREFSLLSAEDRSRCTELICVVETALLQTQNPTSINLASFGNEVPHLHWHIVARFEWDSHFPEPIWGSRRRSVDPIPASRLLLPAHAVDAAIRESLSRWTFQSLQSPNQDEP